MSAIKPTVSLMAESTVSGSNAAVSEPDAAWAKIGVAFHTRTAWGSMSCSMPHAVIGRVVLRSNELAQATCQVRELPRAVEGEG